MNVMALVVGIMIFALFFLAITGICLLWDVPSKYTMFMFRVAGTAVVLDVLVLLVWGLVIDP